MFNGTKIGEFGKPLLCQTKTNLYTLCIYNASHHLACQSLDSDHLLKNYCHPNDPVGNTIHGINVLTI